MRDDSGSLGVRPSTKLNLDDDDCGREHGRNNRLFSRRILDEMWMELLSTPDLGLIQPDSV